MAGAQDFTTKGYPTIATVGGFFIFAYTLYYSAAKTGYGGWRNHGVWFFTNLLLWLFGLFLVFGPDSLTVAAATTAGPRAAILWLQLMVQASIGAFAIYSANAYASLVFALVGIFNELALIGSLWLFNYNQPIWILDTNQCNAYFSNAASGPDFQVWTRCHDDGYLEFLRVIGTLEILVNGFLIVISLLAYATAIPVGHPAGYPAAGAPVGGPYNNAAGYNAGPAYATTGPGYAQGGPVVTQTTTQSTPYTTTTAVPATTSTQM